MQKTPVTNSLSVSPFSEQKPSITEISANLAGDLKKGKDYPREQEDHSQLEKHLRDLLHHAQSFDVSAIDPFRIVEDIIKTLQEKHFQTTSPRLKLLLAQALHAYVDLAVLKMFQDEQYEVLMQGKNHTLQVLEMTLEEFTTSKGEIATIEIRYAFTCAHAGILALRDTNGLKEEGIDLMKRLGQIFSGKNLGDNLASIRTLTKRFQKEWYLHALEIRVLTDLAQGSTKHLDQLRRVMAEPELTEGNIWQVSYAIQEALGQIVMAGSSYTIQQTAFSGHSVHQQGLASFLQFVQRALSPPYYDEHVFHYYRAIVALTQMSHHPQRWLQQEANRWLTKAVKSERSPNHELLNLANKSTLVEVPTKNQTTPKVTPRLKEVEYKTWGNSDIAQQTYAAMVRGDAAANAGDHLKAAELYLEALSALEKLAKQNADQNGIGKLFTTVWSGVKNTLNYLASNKLFPPGIDPVAVLQQRLDQLRAIEYFHALYPLLMDTVSESRPCSYSR